MKKNLPGRGLTKVEKHWCRQPCYSRTMNPPSPALLLLAKLLSDVMTRIENTAFYQKKRMQSGKKLEMSFRIADVFGAVGVSYLRQFILSCF